MSEIVEALNRLSEALGGLETIADHQSQEVVELRQQQDLFSNGALQAANNGLAVDPAVIAQRLDSAIEKVEQVLREG